MQIVSSTATNRLAHDVFRPFCSQSCWDEFPCLFIFWRFVLRAERLLLPFLVIAPFFD